MTEEMFSAQMLGWSGGAEEAEGARVTKQTRERTAESLGGPLPDEIVALKSHRGKTEEARDDDVYLKRPAWQKHQVLARIRGREGGRRKKHPKQIERERRQQQMENVRVWRWIVLLLLLLISRLQLGLNNVQCSCVAAAEWLNKRQDMDFFF